MRTDLVTRFAREDLLYLGATCPDVALDFEKYQSWLSEKRHAGMVYLERNESARKDANQILTGTRSILVFGMPYFFEDKTPSFRYALYSQFKDYHKLMKNKARRLVNDLQKEVPGEYRVVVDSAPVLERALAAKTVEGFIGKNTCFIHPKYGSFILLGEIFTTSFFPNDKPAKEAGCGSCTLCQVECPTGALDDDYQIDARKCLAYWTIENQGTIPCEYWPYLKDYVFGCDICQRVCPFNKETPNALPKSVEIRKFPDLFSVATMNQYDYEIYFGGTPVTRAKREGLRRNALISMTVSQHPRLREALNFIERDPHPVLCETRLQIDRYLQIWREGTATRLDTVAGLDSYPSKTLRI